MEILKPPIIYIGGRCYRRNPIKQGNINTAEQEDTMADLMGNEVAWNTEESCDIDTNIEKITEGYRISMAIPSVLFKFVIGRKGETKRRLETETRTQIRIPRQGQTGDIVIQGHERNGVLSAKTRIDVILDSARQKQPFTHFFSIPITTTNIKDNLDDFKADVLRECDGDKGIDSSIFQNPDRLHLTIGCFALLDDSEVAKLTDLFLEVQDQLIQPILKSEPLMVQVKGLEYMNDDPSEVDVLYAKIEDTTDRLQILADRLVDKFTSTGLMQREFTNVKLHITVMNTLFRRDPSGTAEPQIRQDRGRVRESFYATNILKKFGQYDFGTYHVKGINLSQRHSYGKDGYYTCTGNIGLP